MCFLTSNEIYADMPIYGDVGDVTGLTLTSTSAAESRYLCFYYAKTGGSDSSTSEEIQSQLAEVMINEGNAALPYQPYGYKIPVSNNTDDYVIYLTEPLQKIGSYVDDVESTGIITRSIKKIVLDGSEEWQKYGSDEYAYFRLGTGDTTGVRNILSDRFEFVENFEDVTTVGASISGTGQIRIRPSDVSDMSILEWSTWLSENPTTIYYTISTSTTETTTCPVIDTDEGSNTFDVDTTVTPSNVILYHT